MFKYRYARVKCICGKVNKVPRYGSSVTCDCGAQLSTESPDGVNEQPMATVPDDYNHGGRVPQIVGWTSKAS